MAFAGEDVLVAGAFALLLTGLFGEEVRFGEFAELSGDRRVGDAHSGGESVEAGGAVVGCKPCAKPAASPTPPSSNAFEPSGQRSTDRYLFRGIGGHHFDHESRFETASTLPEC